MNTSMTLSFPGGKCIDVHLDQTVIHTDQSPKYGGEGSAPEPFQYFLASIASCAGVYAVAFCERRDISTEGLGLSLTAVEDAEAKRVGRIEIRLTLPPGFPDKYRNAILRAMDQCAVKRHILTPPEFDVALA